MSGESTSDALYARARRTAPGGVHSPVRAFHGVGGTPVFMASGNGAYLTDVDGRRYIDFCLSFGPLILGHHDPVAAAAAHAAIDDGWSYGTCEPYSLALAEWMQARIPWVERLRFVSSGTEAVMSALRVARAATGRSHILKLDGCYHGHSDGLLVRAGSGLAGRVAASSAGLPEEMIAHTLVAPLDDEAAVDALFAQHPSSIAAVIVEPVPANYGLLAPRKAWMRHLADCCKRHGTLLVFDEVITGFRTGLMGAAAFFGLTPDLVCYGKIIGGGFPVGAYGGRADLMDLVAPAGPVYQAGTLSANPVGMRVGLATLQRMVDLDGWRALEARTSSFVLDLARRMAEVLLAMPSPASEAATPASSLQIAQHTSIFWMAMGGDGPIRRPDRIPAGHAAWYARFFHAALSRGVYLPPSPYEVCFLSMAHDAAILEEAANILVAAAQEAAGV